MKDKTNNPNQPSPHCTLDTKEKVAAVVIAALQLRFPDIEITPTTKLDDDLGLDGDAAATLLPGMMRQATRDGGCETRLGSEAYRSLKTVQDIVDAIREDLKDKCNL